MKVAYRLKKCKTHTINSAAERDYIFMLLVIAIILVLLWGGGFALHVAGSLIHFLLLVALVLFILHFVTGRRTV